MYASLAVLAFAVWRPIGVANHAIVDTGIITVCWHVLVRLVKILRIQYCINVHTGIHAYMCYVTYIYIED